MDIRLSTSITKSDFLVFKYLKDSITISTSYGMLTLRHSVRFFKNQEKFRKKSDFFGVFYLKIREKFIKSLHKTRKNFVFLSRIKYGTGYDLIFSWVTYLL